MSVASRCLAAWAIAACVAVGQAGALPVTTARPTSGDVVRTFRVAGDVRPFEEVIVYSKVTGFVEEIRVDLGSRVKAGDVLARLAAPELAEDRKILEIRIHEADLAGRIAEAGVAEKASLVVAASARVAAAEAVLEARRVSERFARANLDRFRMMHEEGSATQQTLDEAELTYAESSSRVATASADLATARADVAAAEQAVAHAMGEVELAAAMSAHARAALVRDEVVARYLEIRAPFAGVVVERFVHTGALVKGGGNNSDPTMIVRLVSAGRVRVVVSLPESEVAHVAVGAKATLAGVGLGSDVVDASVSAVAGALTPSNRTMPIEIHSSDPRLIPGLSLYVTLDMEKHAGVLTVPSEALHYEKRKPFLWTIVDGKAEKVPVTVGFNDLRRAEVGGVGPGAAVIVSSRAGLKTGMPVRTADGGN